MSSLIEDYAMIGDCQTAALVSRTGSIDWLCFPRFDSSACFAALLGTPEHGRWRLAPEGELLDTRRRYRPGTLILETEYETGSGTVLVTDFMPVRSGLPDLVRMVSCSRGHVAMRMELVVRFDYGDLLPWIRPLEGGILAIAGPEVLCLRAPVPLSGDKRALTASFTIREGERVPFTLTWFNSSRPVPLAIDPYKALETTEGWWREWSDRSTYHGAWEDAVMRSLIALKALTYAPTGGIVAAATTSLPEHLGGTRNWDYRYCWLRDATFTLYALMVAGYVEEAHAWREWLLRAVAGEPAQMRIMYGVGGERRLLEYELAWLPGYEGSRPVRVGNAAYHQFQLDVFGEVADAFHFARRAGLEPHEAGWELERDLLDFLESAWREPDEGIWEVRGPRRHFTHSKVMAWVAVDRGIKAVEQFGLEGPVERWRALRAEMHREICAHGFNAGRGSFVQYYGGDRLDASLLMMPLVGFLPATDPHMRATIEAIERELVVDGFVMRYLTTPDIDGLPSGEGAFLACTFWLVDNLILLGRTDDARVLFERLLALRNDVGLLSEEYDPVSKRLVGNFPQAFSHIALVNSARNLASSGGPADERRSC